MNRSSLCFYLWRHPIYSTSGWLFPPMRNNVSALFDYEQKLNKSERKGEQKDVKSYKLLASNCRGPAGRLTRYIQHNLPVFSFPIKLRWGNELNSNWSVVVLFFWVGGRRKEG